ncbi:MAG: hypothetical protein NVSMB14_09840 [Isosphaeraceae bacterium]
MRKCFAWGLSALVVGAFVATTAVVAKDGLKSGLQVGDVATPYDVQDITGPNKGRTLCYT